MPESNLERLKEFGEIADSLEEKVMSDSYWEKEEEILKKRIAENKKTNQSILMSSAKFKECFSL